ncbi:MAG: hypothetical protein U5L45_18435 [Saprospiraceae bacterium]|nr:hypothetical protein [Saprospiraceae bacterium]
MTAETLFQRQLDYIFDRPTTTEPAWYFTEFWQKSDEAIFPYDNHEVVFAFMENLLKNAGKYLEIYSNDQIGLGFNYIFNNSCSNMTHDIREADVPFDRKISLLENLFSLFKEVFNERCLTETSAYAAVLSPPLNNICYMFWDVTPLSYWGNIPKTERKDYYEAIAMVMQRCLSLKNPACVESGLHGLGHMVSEQPNIAVPIIDAFLAKPKNPSSKIIKYAKQARTGMIL